MFKTFIGNIMTVAAEDYDTVPLFMDAMFFAETSNNVFPNWVGVKKLADTGYLKVTHRPEAGEIDIDVNKLDVSKAIYSLLCPYDDFEERLEEADYLEKALQKVYSDNKVDDEKELKFWRTYRGGKFYHYSKLGVMESVSMCEDAFLKDAQEKYENDLADEARKSPTSLTSISL